MPRPLHSPLHWLLWLVIALLPLRGWAWAAMLPAELDAATGTTTVVVAEDPLPPCHRLAAVSLQAVTDQISAADHTTTDSSSPHPGCTLCSLCHAAAAPAAILPLTLPALLPHTPPVGTAPPPPGWRADAPERPPKA